MDANSAPSDMESRSAGERCGQPTEGGTPCKLRPLSGRGGVCHFHANLPLTKAHLQAARRNAVRHGFFATGILDGEGELYEELREAVQDPSTLRRDLAAFAYLRAIRVAGWESRHAAPAPVADAALGRASRVLDDLPPRAEPAHECLTDTEVERQVDALLADHEFFLKRLKPQAREAVRKALREAGEAPDGS